MKKRCGCDTQGARAGRPSWITRGQVVLALLAVCAAVAWARSPSGRVTRPPASAADATGLQFRLSSGQPITEGRTPGMKRATATPLAANLAARLLAVLPPLQADPADTTEFKMRPGSLPRPRPGQTIPLPFPPPPSTNARPLATGEAQVSPDSLAVLRYAPQGNVPIAPQMSVTFSQPMVAVTSLADLAAQDVPVKLSPEPPGKWRWIGTRTLLFEAAGNRMPMATTYTVTVPAGTRDTAGHALAQETKFTFTTPPPQVTSFHPQGSPIARDPVMVAVFDQKVDPAAVLAMVNASPRASLKLVGKDEIDGDARSIFDQAEPGRVVAFRATTPFSTNTGVSVTFPAGVPSLEGPNKTDRPQSFSFHTYGPMVVTDHGCGYGEECPPLAPWHVRFSNPIDTARFKPEMVKVTPPLPDLKVKTSGAYMYVGGRSRGRTSYTITIDPSLRDVFGQTLTDSKPLVVKVGSARPSLAAAGSHFIVADPYVTPGYTVFTVNHPTLRVRIHAVTPDDWPAFHEFMQHVGDDKFPTIPGKKVQDTTVAPKGAADELTETTVDLRPALKDGLGHVIIVVEPTVQPKERWRRQRAVAWVEGTRIGLDAFVDDQRMTAWATRLTDGQPLAGVTVALSRDPLNSLEKGPATDSKGVATIDLPERGASHRVLVAKQGSDVAILPQDKYWWSSGDAWQKRARHDTLRWCVFDDRGIYKPNETVHFKGWLRILAAGPAGDIRGLAGAGKSVHYRVLDSRGNEVGKGDVPVNGQGGFDGSFKLPDNLNLGGARLVLTSDVPGVTGGGFEHGFQVQEFRRPEFEVTTTAPPSQYVIGGHARVSTEAKYYAGGALGNADVTWNVTATPGSYSPPGHADFTFGRWVPWFWSEDGAGSTTTNSRSLAGKTDPAGQHAVRIDFDSVRPPTPTVVNAEATVMDVNRQAWSSSARLLVHPAEEYVGLRRERIFVQPGEPVEVSALVTDIEGKVLGGRPVQIHAAQLDWTWRDGQYEQVEAHPQDVALTSAAEAVKTTLHLREGGTWRIRATVVDAQGRPNLSEILVWVAGGKQPPRRDVSADKVLLVPDKEKYQPGELAHILVQAPFPGSGMLVVSRNGIILTRPFALEGTSATLDIPIEESAIPNLDVQVEVVGAAERMGDDGKSNAKLAKRPGYGLGSLTLQVPPLTRKLDVQAVPKVKAVRPGARTAIDVTVRDAAGKPVADSEVALVVVDESVLALTGYKLVDPLTVYYALRNGEVRLYHGRSDVVLANPEVAVHALDGSAPRGSTSRTGDGPGGGRAKSDGYMRDEETVMSEAAPSVEKAKDKKEGGKQPVDQQAQGPIKMRTDFSALAVFAPSVKTDASGRATVQIKLPDNLTRYRVMAVAVGGERLFGSGENAIVARLPLMIRPSPPRFLNFGDRCEVPVVLQNQTDRPMSVQIAMRARNVKLDQVGYSVTVPANDRVEVRFPTSTEMAGTARFQVAARGQAAARGPAAPSDAADAAEFNLPVYTPATTEAFATYGVLDGNGATAQPVKAPSGVFPQFGGLEIELSSTALQALTDAILYLVRYPFECAEQVSSRVLGVVALRDVLSAFHAKGLPDARTLSESVARDIEKLKTMQNGDGSFAFWRRGDPGWPYLTVHVTNALVRAKEKGYAVPSDMLERSRGYLRSIESHIPHWYGPRSRNAIIAYALNVRWRMGDRDVARARKLAQTGLPASTGNTPTQGTLSVEAVAWLLPVLASTAPAEGAGPEKRDASSAQQIATLERFLHNRVTETAGSASFQTGYEDGQYLLLATDRRADAIVLEALVQVNPKSDLIPKIVRGLLGHRSAGRWANTQENVFVLLALDRYFNAFEKTTPDFVARLWLGNDYAGEQAFRGRSTNRYAVSVPMQTVVQPPETKDLTISKQGAGRLYYRIGMRYAPRDLTLKPLEAGFTVQRLYESVDDPKDVTRQADGSWQIRAGARVRVRVTMVAPTRRVHVALVDPLPAGLEALNPALAVQGAVPADESARKDNPWWYWMRPWYEHQNLRDERVEAFTSLLWEGVYDYTYYARATTPGSFVVPPTKAEEMYSPEVFGRGSTDRVTVR